MSPRHPPLNLAHKSLGNSVHCGYLNLCESFLQKVVDLKGFFLSKLRRPIVLAADLRGILSGPVIITPLPLFRMESSPTSIPASHAPRHRLCSVSVAARHALWMQSRTASITSCGATLRNHVSGIGSRSSKPQMVCVAARRIIAARTIMEHKRSGGWGFSKFDHPCQSMGNYASGSHPNATIPSIALFPRPNKASIRHFQKPVSELGFMLFGNRRNRQRIHSDGIV